MRLHRNRARLAAVLLMAEVLIALFVRDDFVRPYVGDVLVVMLIFFSVLTFWRVRPVPLAMGVLLFAFLVEITQALGLIHWLGWTDSTMARIVLGNTFQWGDLVCYTTGAMASVGTVWTVERRPPHT